MGELFQQAEAWLDRIEQTQDYTLPYVDLESKTEPVRLNLMMSFWFYDGDQLEVKEKFVKKIQDYIALTGVEFQQEASVKNQRERKFRKEGFPENLLEDIKKEKDSVIYYFSDQPKMSFAPKYGVKAMCNWANLKDFHSVYVDRYVNGKEIPENFVVCKGEEENEDK